jgi:gas vesicle protein
MTQSSRTIAFLVGIAVGGIVGILLAPGSGEETRDYLSEKANQNKARARQKARELRERADDLLNRSRDVVTRQKDSLVKAVEAGREAYLRGSSRGSTGQPG